MALEFPIECKLNNKIYSSFRGLANYLRTVNYGTKQYYDEFHKTPGEDICYCGNTIQWDSGRYNKHCSNSCATKSEEHRLAVSNRYKGSDRDEKLKLFNERRGKVDPNVKKARKTMVETAKRLGFDSLSDYQSFIRRQAAKNISDEKRKEMNLKRMETISKTKNYGGRSYYREYKLFDEIVKIQGYEDIVLDYLQEKFTKDELIAGGKNFGYIEYFDENQKRHIYFPDALLPNFVVEVKSNYTFEMHKANVYEKIGGCFQNNKNIILIIPSKSEVRKGKLESSKKLLDWAISSQASNHQEPFVLMYDEGSTTILYGVESSDSKCRGSQRNLRECDIVWSAVKIAAADDSSAEIQVAKVS